MKPVRRWSWALTFGSAVVIAVAVVLAIALSPHRYVWVEDFIADAWPSAPSREDNECAFRVTGVVTVEGVPAKRLLVGFSFTSRGEITRASTITDDQGRFSLLDPERNGGCFGTERYVAVEGGYFSSSDGLPTQTNFGPVQRGEEVKIDLRPFRIN